MAKHVKNIFRYLLVICISSCENSEFSSLTHSLIEMYWGLVFPVLYIFQISTISAIQLTHIFVPILKAISSVWWSKGIFFGVQRFLILCNPWFPEIIYCWCPLPSAVQGSELRLWVSSNLSNHHLGEYSCALPARGSSSWACWLFMFERGILRPSHEYPASLYHLLYTTLP